MIFSCINAPSGIGLLTAFGLIFLVIVLVIIGIVSAVIWAIRGDRQRDSGQETQESAQEQLRHEQEIAELEALIRRRKGNRNDEHNC